jgi:hypothetical protein
VTWLFAPVPRARIAWLRLLAYLFLIFDMLLLTSSSLAHARLPHDLYRPVLLARVLHVPAPDLGVMWALLVVVLGCGLACASGRLPRTAGYVLGFGCAAGYLWWVIISMSYGKVDHDHLALVVALFVLPTAGPARLDDRTPAEAAGWAVRCIELAVVAAYFLSAWAKMRFGGPGWPNGSTLAWAINRRGTPPARLLLDYPWILHLNQWITVVMEFSSPLLLVLRGRPLYALVAFWAGFHVITYAMMTIHFLPHAIFLTAFLPLELLPALARDRWRRAGSTSAVQPVPIDAG